MSDTALGPAGVTRFLVVCGPRTGSNMLCSALNSHPGIVCFREVFNFMYADAIDYYVDGYDHRDADDVELRARDPIAYLRSRIFGQDPVTTAAAGFKYMYDHVWGFPGLLEALQADKDIRIVHLMRRNGVRAFLSYKTAFATGEWQRPKRRMLSTRIGYALAHPAYTLTTQFSKVRDRIAPPDTRIVLDPEECIEYIHTREEQHEHFRNVFAGHPIVEVYYEDIVARREEQFSRVLQFLSVEPAELRESVEKQNAGPLRDLVRNYGELAAALAPTQHAWMIRKE